jgi:hypothetical protein
MSTQTHGYDYKALFIKHFNNAEQHHYATPERLIEVLKNRMAEKRFGTFGQAHALTTGDERRFLVFVGEHGAVIFGEDTTLHFHGEYDTFRSPLRSERYQNALVKLFLGGYPMHLLLDIVDHQYSGHPLPTETMAERFLKLTEKL